MKPRPRVSPRLILVALSVLILLLLAALVWLLRPDLIQQAFSLQMPWKTRVLPAESTVTAIPSRTPTSRPETPTETVLPAVVPPESQNAAAPDETLREQGVLVLAMRDGYYTHLFAYHPQYLPLTRLTNTPWDDITPALSPDGAKLAYSSRQNGYWDLFILDLTTGKQTRLTDTPEYEASPTWSPDSQWIAYERYNGISLDIYLLSLVDQNPQPIQLTDDKGTDRLPAWSPNGREIAFVSTRSGDEDIWLARLDDADHRFVDLSKSPTTRDRSPVWSRDGQRLAWTAEKNGDRQMVVLDINQPDLPARPVGAGDRAAWSPDGSLMYSEIRSPNGTALTAYHIQNGRLGLPLTDLPGALEGMVWIPGPLPAWLDATLAKADTAPTPILWQPAADQPTGPGGRVPMIQLPDVTAPQPMLHDGVNEAFNALRQEIAAETGWDTLSSLENAFVPLTTPPTPSIVNDWLYTGRAFAFNPLLLSAGWVTIVREDFSGQTYWHVYLKARYQDGSMGMPLSDMVWDINARFTGDPRNYEQGGKLGPVPPGYWIDLTELAGRYGWERLPSGINWRTFFPAIRFNTLVMTGGLSWDQALREVYPIEALSTPTALPTMTLTPTETPKVPARAATETPTPTLTQVPTRRPTWTPLANPPTP